MWEKMKLYGVAVAVVPKQDNPNSYNVICTPIAMDQANQRNFHILENLKYKADFDSMDLASTAEAFAKMVQMINAVTKMQEKSCKAAGVEYRPTALVIGEHSQQKVKLDGIYTLLFGEKNPIQFSWIKEDRKQTVDEDYHVRRSVRDAYLAKNAIPYTFKEACKKVHSLVKKCAFRMGGFVPPSNLDDPELNTPNKLDAELKRLKPLFEQGDTDACNRLIQIAAEEGKKFAEKAWMGNALYLSKPRNYATDPKLQEQLPRFGFYHWDETFSYAFHEAYAQHHWDRGHISVKLPLDSVNPFFTDVVADGIRTQFEIVEGKRKPDEYERGHDELLEEAIAPMANIGSRNATSSLPPL